MVDRNRGRRRKPALQNTSEVQRLAGGSSGMSTVHYLCKSSFSTYAMSPLKKKKNRAFAWL